MFLTVLCVFASERLQIVWPSCLCWWPLDFLWANFQFGLFHHLVLRVYHRPQVTPEPQGALWAEMSVVACCPGVILGAAFALSHDFMASSCELM